MSDFYKYFKENMDALGLPAPESVFGTATAAVANAAAILGQIDKMGRAVTVGEHPGCVAIRRSTPASWRPAHHTTYA